LTQDNTPIDLLRSQQTQAAALLARAFQDDSLFRYAIPDDDRRAKALSWLLDKVVLYSLLYGKVYTTPAVEGVVCWLAPGQAELTPYRVLRTGLQHILGRFGWAAYRRFDLNQQYVAKSPQTLCTPGSLVSMGYWRGHWESGKRDRWRLASTGSGVGQCDKDPVLSRDAQ